MTKQVGRKAILNESEKSLNVCLKQHLGLPPHVIRRLRSKLEEYISSPIHTLDAVEGCEPDIKPFSYWLEFKNDRLIHSPVYVRAKYRFEHRGKISFGSVRVQREAFAVIFELKTIPGQPNVSNPDKITNKLTEAVRKWKAEMDIKVEHENNALIKCTLLSKWLGVDIEPFGSGFRSVVGPDPEKQFKRTEIKFHVSEDNCIRISSIDADMRIDQFREIIRVVHDKAHNGNAIREMMGK